MKAIRFIMNKIDERSVRERAIIFIGLVAVLFSAWDAMLNAPLVTKHKLLTNEFNNKNAERFALNTRLQELIEKNQLDPDADNRARLETLTGKLAALDAELEVSTSNLVKPEQMPRLLETVLNETRGLTLHSLKSLSVAPLVEQDEDGSATASGTGKVSADNIASAFKHGIRIEFNGDYFSTMAYLRKLEQLEWGFFWDNFTLDVEAYPDTRAAIEIFTLSLSRQWIGV